MRRWHQSLSFRLMLVHVVVLGLLIMVSVGMIYAVQRRLLIHHGEQCAEQMGLRVVSDLNGLILQTQCQTRVMADLAQVIKPDEQDYRKLFGQIIVPDDMRNVVAGGGIWPEPYTFDPARKRRSFFWGMQPNGKLKFYDDYNDPNGPGYHDEHWYSPAHDYPPGAAIWSRSYTDPYSHEPMVTCSVPIYQKDTFTGVATIDLKLDGLNRTLVQATRSTGGYMFVVDRDGRFVAFPRMNMIRKQEPDGDGHSQTHYLQLQDLADQMPGMRRILELHNEMNIRMLQNAQQNMVDFTIRVDELMTRDPHLDRQQAQLLIASMFDQTRIKAVNPQRVRRMRLTSMPLVDESCMVSVFHMPRTYWNVVMVMPVSAFTVSADQASGRLALWLGGLQLLVIVLLFVAVRLLVIRPINRGKERELRVAYALGDDSDIQDKLSDTESAMDQLRQMIRNRRQPQLEEQSTRTSEVVTDVHQLIADIINVHCVQMQAMKVQYHVDVNFEDFLLVDAYRLGQVLTNIIANARTALKDVPEGQRELDIKARLINQQVLQISITDSGCGIDPKIMPKIYNYGYSTHAETRGIGLHSAMQAVSELAGSLGAHSDGPDHGTTFILSIPVQVYQSKVLDNANI